MKMKETLKFLKFGLIGVASVTAISTLAISCNEKKNENANNNNSNSTQKPGDTTKPETPVDAETKKKLEEAKNKFTVTLKEGSNHSTIRANEITKENFNNYFTLNGKLEGFTYTLTKLETNGEHGLTVYHSIELNGHKIESSTPFNGFKGLNLIDYDHTNQNDFFSIALDKQHLNTIAFAAQKYTAEHLVKKGWTLKFENKNNYELTNTGKYIFFNGKKMNVWKIKFVIEKPIRLSEFLGDTTPVDSTFTDQGKKYHDENGGFQIAIEDGVNELV